MSVKKFEYEGFIQSHLLIRLVLSFCRVYQCYRNEINIRGLPIALLSIQYTIVKELWYSLTLIGELSSPPPPIHHFRRPCKMSFNSPTFNAKGQPSNPTWLASSGGEGGGGGGGGGGAESPELA